MGEFLLTLKADCRAAERGARRDHYAAPPPHSPPSPPSSPATLAALFSSDSLPEMLFLLFVDERVPPARPTCCYATKKNVRTVIAVHLSSLKVSCEGLDASLMTAESECSG